MNTVQENRRSVVLGIIGVTISYAVFKNRLKIQKSIKRFLDFKNPLRHQDVKIVETEEQCKAVINILRSHTKSFNVLGFDCEWVTVEGTRRPVALLQLASHKGLCALIRLCELDGIPKTLRELLEDESVLKVGVAPSEDASKLSYDYGVGVANTLDLRYLAVVTNTKPQGLARMSQNLLNVELDKHWRIRCSDWEARQLTERQIDYAAKDALVGVEIFKTLSNKLDEKRYFWEKSSLEKVFASINQYKDIKFTQSNIVANINAERRNSLEPERTVRKQAKRHYSTRATKLYDNVIVKAPDGEVLSTIDAKKAMWYLDKGFATVVTSDPLAIRLNFEPAGRNVGEAGKYYATLKENKCVVCGFSHSYIRKNVVPREYRRLFPDIMKSHSSHDVLLLCPDCHQRSNISDCHMRRKLASMCQAPCQGEKRAIKKYQENIKLK